MPRTEDLESTVDRVLAELDYAPVRTRIVGGGRPTIQVMAERRDGTALSIEDCTAISRALSPALDAVDPLPGAYRLEVSSAGIDRPLVRRADFERFVGAPAEVTTKAPIEGRRRFRGRLAGVAEDRVVLDCEQGLAHVPLAAVAEARLAITRELLARKTRPGAPPGRG
jgi:ribosome maturation factor RimP